MQAHKFYTIDMNTHQGIIRIKYADNYDVGLSDIKEAQVTIR
jgi:hypothetical protein